jgi:hypothetical protein
MHYQKIYDQIIERAVKEVRKKGQGIYLESHHIVPKCIGGSNDSTNKALLTAREHFICHWLLYRIYPNNHRLCYAFWMMCRVRNKDQSDRYRPSATSFAEARQANAIANAAVKRGIPSKRKGINLSKEHVEKLVKVHTGKSTAKKGRSYPHLHMKQEVVKCSTCGKEGGSRNMKRYHFDNCGKISPIKGSKREKPNSNKGKPGILKSAEWRDKISNTLGMPVLDLQSGIVYPSIKKAATALGVDPGTIRYRIKKGLFSTSEKKLGATQK